MYELVSMNYIEEGIQIKGAGQRQYRRRKHRIDVLSITFLNHFFGLHTAQVSPDDPSNIK